MKTFSCVSARNQEQVKPGRKAKIPDQEEVKLEVSENTVAEI